MPVRNDVKLCSSDAERGRNSRSVSVYLRARESAPGAARPTNFGHRSTHNEMC